MQTGWRMSHPLELERVESELNREEQSLEQALTQLGAESSALELRAQAARSLASSVAASGVGDGGVAARLAGLALPSLSDAAAARAHAQQAREWAARARLEAAQQLRQLLSASQQQLATLGARLRQDEDLLQRLQADARRAAELAQQQRQQAALAAQAATRAERPRPPVAAAKAAPVAPDQRRKSPRVALRAAVDFSSDDNYFTGFSANISEGGIFVATCDVLPIGTEVDLSFSLPAGGQVHTPGVVRWVRENDDRAPDVFPGIGVQFSRLDAAAAAEIHRFLAERDPMFYAD